MTFTPTDAANYNGATQDGHDQRREGDAGRSPGRRPADIVYGTALERDAAERDRAPCAGTFVYTPAAGTVLNAGARRRCR